MLRTVEIAPPTNSFKPTPGKTRLRFAVVLVAGAGHAQR